MIRSASSPRWRLLPVALTLSACLTSGCESLKAKPQEPSLTVAPPARAVLPDPPPTFKRCFVPVKLAGETIEDITRHLYQIAERRRACGDGLLKWYAGVQKANAGPKG